ncbi:hypothetical protein [Methylorubrum populi]|uniref:hypothetical protein n=1 Tax=Methylorubrum populi TaxID=223967 RepID=UPI000DB396A1|nr:hypothetical protein [Methylorubrum populi]PZP71728.1 MAG: hypothetical protein DI590_05555 [Methylorubrum populi]
MSASGLLWYATWAYADLFLLLTLIGAVSASEQSFGTRVWAVFGVMTLILGVNAYALSLIGF